MLGSVYLVLTFELNKIPYPQIHFPRRKSKTTILPTMPCWMSECYEGLYFQQIVQNIKVGEGKVLQKPFHFQSIKQKPRPAHCGWHCCLHCWNSWRNFILFSLSLSFADIPGIIVGVWVVRPPASGIPTNTCFPLRGVGGDC